ncbi:MAG: hypothetical protein WDO69_33495 [Pseudomonadota bacterium]
MSNDVVRVNAPEVAVSIDFHPLCVPSPPATTSPIDEYYQRSQAVIVASAGAEDWLLRLLLLDLISAAETYFRRVLAGVINACAESRSIAATQNVSLGAIDYYGLVDVGFGILENSALSGTSELKKKTKALTGLEIKQGSSVDAALDAFERICHLRHAAVHAKGELGSRNLAELGLRVKERRSLHLTSLTFQPIALQCQSAVRAFNQFVFSGILARWVDRAALSGKWDEDAEAFSTLFALFASEVDVPAIDRKKAYASVLPIIVARAGK